MSHKACKSHNFYATEPNSGTPIDCPYCRLEASEARVRELEKLAQARTETADRYADQLGNANNRIAELEADNDRLREQNLLAAKFAELTIDDPQTKLSRYENGKEAE